MLAAGWAHGNDGDGLLVQCFTVTVAMLVGKFNAQIWRLDFPMIASGVKGGQY